MIARPNAAVVHEEPPSGRAPALTDEEFARFRDLIQRETGIFLRDSKRLLIVARLARRLRQLRVETFGQYYELLTHADPRKEELRVMINCITTNKTSFFRENHHFEYLRDELVPLWVERRNQTGEARIRIWSAGCSSGEEPYSIIMTLAEALGTLSGWDVKILASDIDTDMLQHGASAVYPEADLPDIGEQRKRRHFLRGTGCWRGHVQIHPRLREAVRFWRINLIEEDWPIRTRFDAVFCRNALIYFDRNTQRRVIERFAGYMEPHSRLFVGHSENLFWLTDLLASVQPTIYRLKHS